MSQTKFTPGPWKVITKFTPGPWKVIKPGHGHKTEYLCVRIGKNKSYATLEMLPADARLVAAAPDLLAFAKAHEQWEANLILSDKAWGGGMAEFPRLTQELLDEFMEVQAMRNAAVKKATAPKGSTP